MKTTTMTKMAEAVTIKMTQTTVIVTMMTIATTRTSTTMIT